MSITAARLAGGARFFSVRKARAWLSKSCEVSHFLPILKLTDGNESGIVCGVWADLPETGPLNTKNRTAKDEVLIHILVRWRLIQLLACRKALADCFP